MKTNETYQDHEPGYPGSEVENMFMHDWVFHFNPFTQTWAAIPRDKYIHYWSDASLKEVLRSNSINTLIDILYKTQGDLAKIAKLIRE